MTDFAAEFFNVFSQKVTDTVTIKHHKEWPYVLKNFSHLLQALTEGFNTPTFTMLLKIFNHDQRKRDRMEFEKSSIDQSDCLLKMTISLFELTTKGWKQTMPGGIYFF